MKRSAKPGQNAAVEELQAFVEENKPLSTKSKKSQNDEKNEDEDEIDDFVVEEDEEEEEEDEEEKIGREKGIEEKDEDSNSSKKAAIKSANGTKREASLGLKQEKRVHINESDFSLEEDSILESRSKKRTVVISDSD